MGIKNLNGKRVLFVAPRFFSYEIDIKSELERRGAIVDWLPDRPYDTPVLKALTSLSPSWILPFADRLYEQLLNNFSAQHYDIILVINGQTLSRSTLTRLRATYPQSRFVLYMWDSIANRKHVQYNLAHFDRICTFDPTDAKQYGMVLRPLFYGHGFETPTVPSSTQYHISFIGTAHTDRFQVVNSLRKKLSNDISSYWYLYLQAPWVFQYYRLTRPAMREAKQEDFHFKPLEKRMLHTLFANSHTVLDIEHPNQVGLTMRTFETLGSGKKLATTNMEVRNYDFFSEQNICIIDRKSPFIPHDFLVTPFEPLAESIRKRYSIEGWIDELLEL
ncbi:hypothetical protein ABH309_01765 [Chromobacterium piscinae]|uniref:Eps11J n=1 Tax=Chromobacterium piscinae TaxID=686831 RepID=A0ABV0GZC2_9NEIS